MYPKIMRNKIYHKSAADLFPLSLLHLTSKPDFLCTWHPPDLGILLKAKPESLFLS